MLVITRKKNESFYIGEDIKITILSNTANQFKIGIEAPADLLILRDELTQFHDDEETISRELSTTAVIKKRRRLSLLKSLLPL